MVVSTRSGPSCNARKRLCHPEPLMRRQCAIAANVLRGIIPDDAGSTFTDLSLALIEASGDSAARGLRVTYHFANLPDDLPPEVVEAFSSASAEALSNVVTHAGISRARLSALAAGDTLGLPVNVVIADKGSGFDPGSTPAGYGITHSIFSRMKKAGGGAAVDSYPGEGCRIELWWPE